MKKTEAFNRLIHETSPYLKQHAQNPVNWFPWSKEALEKARDENKPVFLSIGYSACHWCHVMEHESFENRRVSDVLNAHFISIKVDREERPDLDAYFMKAVQLLTGRGGWPLSVFLTPDLKPFYGGTYFPPENRHGMPAFITVLYSVKDAWHSQNQKILETSGLVEKRIIELSDISAPPDSILPDMNAAVKSAIESFDKKNGGFSPAPKFPQASLLRFLLDYSVYTKTEELLDAVLVSLDQMAAGGIYDHAGGGFHRYSVDQEWLVPHFEKMLYDNALLAPVYADAWLVTGKNRYKRTAEGMLDYLKREMTDPSGAFYSSIDADSEGEEGKYYLWNYDEVISLLNPDEDKLLRAAFDISRNGNFEGRIILRLKSADAHFSAEEENQIKNMMEKIRKKRSSRIPPDTDQKILADWNSLAVSAFAKASAVFNRIDYLNTAKNAVRFILDNLEEEGVLYHSFLEKRSSVQGFLADYAYFIQALLDLHETDGSIQWLRLASEWMNRAINRFAAPEGGFYQEAENQNELPARTRDILDKAEPSAEGIMLQNAVRLSRLKEDDALENFANKAIRSASQKANTWPLAAAAFLNACASSAYGSHIQVKGCAKHETTKRMLKEIHARFIPWRVLGINYIEEMTKPDHLPAGGEKSAHAQMIICSNRECFPAAASIDMAKKQLNKISPSIR